MTDMEKDVMFQRLIQIEAKIDRLLAIVDKPKVVRKPKVATEAEIFNRMSFDCWWDQYPKKRGDKKRCFAIWVKNDLSSLQTTLILDVKNRIANDQQWQDIQYIPNPQTYLNGKLWENALIPIWEKIEPLPRDDNKLMSWAADHDYPGPYKAETYTAYRGRLQAIHNGENV